MSLTASIFNAIALIPNILIDITWKDVIDILLVAIIIYLIFLFIKQTKTFFIINAVVALLIIYYLSVNFNLSLVRQFFQPLLTFIIVILVIVFQKELRLFVRWITKHSNNPFGQSEISLSMNSIDSICKAVSYMSDKMIGGIIVLHGEQPIDDLLDGGFQADSKISNQMILSIFDSHTPGHDGAVTIFQNRIKKFGAQLPLAERMRDVRTLGTRHRAAVGITEQSDALAIVVSEERGTISIAENGNLRIIHQIETLKQELVRFLKENTDENTPFQNFWTYFVLKNWKLKITAVFVTFFLWFFLVFQSGIITQEINVPIEIKFLPKEFAVEGTGTTTITTTISGNKKDLENFDIKTIQLQIDAKNFDEGKKEIIIEKKMFSVPAYIQIQKFEPKLIQINVKTVEQIKQEENVSNASSTKVGK